MKYYRLLKSNKIFYLTTTLFLFLTLCSNANASLGMKVRTCVNPLQTNYLYSTGGVSNNLTVKQLNTSAGVNIIDKGVGIWVFSGPTLGICPSAPQLSTTNASAEYNAADSLSKIMYLSVVTPTYRKYVNGSAVDRNFNCQFGMVPLRMVIGGQGLSTWYWYENSTIPNITIDGVNNTCTLKTTVTTQTVYFTWQ